MFRCRRKRVIPNWYKLIEDRKTIKKYKKYIILCLIVDCIICIPLIKELKNYKVNSSKITKIATTQEENKVITLKNKVICDNEFKENLKEIDLKEDKLKLTFVFDSIQESNNLISTFQKYSMDIKMVRENEKYIYYIII